MANPKNLHLRIANTGERKVSMAHVLLGEYVFGGGLISPSTSAGLRFFNCPLTETAIVSFEDDQGSQHEKVIQLKGVVPEKIKGDLELIFSIDSNTNEVTLSYKIK